MIRLVVMFALLALLAAVAAYLAGNPGSVRLDIGGWRIDSSVAVLVAFLALWTLVCAAVVRLFGWFRREMPVVGSARQAKRQSRGLDLVNRALVALAAGDHRTARSLADQADLLLPGQTVLHMIQAEAALHSGDRDRARRHFAALEASDDARLIGLRGLVADARASDRPQEALRLARAAFDDNRKSPWVLETLFSLEVSAGNWHQAADTLDRVAREKLLSPPEIASHRGALAYAEAAEAALAGAVDDARKGYQRVLKYRPDFPPAILALVQLDIQGGNRRRADKLIKKTWAKAPSPALARAYKALDVAESRPDWVVRAQKLAGTAPAHMESDILLADAYLDAHQTEQASPVIARLMDGPRDRRVWQLRLREATQLHQDTDAIEEALEQAPHLPQWMCAACGTAAAHWTPLCDSCGSFDQLQPGNQPRSTRAVSPSKVTPLSMITADKNTTPGGRRPKGDASPRQPATDGLPSDTRVADSNSAQARPYDPAEDLWDD